MIDKILDYFAGEAQKMKTGQPVRYRWIKIPILWILDFFDTNGVWNTARLFTSICLIFALLYIFLNR